MLIVNHSSGICQVASSAFAVWLRTVAQIELLLAQSSLKSQRKPAPDNDIWIAAIAKQHDLTVVTRDAHFSAMPGVNVLGYSR